MASIVETWLEIFGQIPIDPTYSQGTAFELILVDRPGDSWRDECIAAFNEMIQIVGAGAWDTLIVMTELVPINPSIEQREAGGNRDGQYYKAVIIRASPITAGSVYKHYCSPESLTGGFIMIEEPVDNNPNTPQSSLKILYNDDLKSG